jgi:hypothetical protein
MLSLLPARGENWPQFRGASGLGYTERDLPLVWNAKTGENIAWRAPLPKSDNPWSSPIVWGDRVFVICVTNQPLNPSRALLSPRRTASLCGRRALSPGPLILKDLRGGYGAPTPCTDGQRVYAVFGSAVVTALDFDGKLVWRKELANYAFDVALGSSPIVYGDTVILDCDQTGKTSSLIAFDKATGEIRWEAKRPENRIRAQHAGDREGRRPDADARERVWRDPGRRSGKWENPVVVRRAGRCVVAGVRRWPCFQRQRTRRESRLCRSDRRGVT